MNVAGRDGNPGVVQRLARVTAAAWRRGESWLSRRIGRRGAFLGFLALVDGVVAYALTQPLPLGLRREQFYGPFLDIMPMSWWITWWITAAVVVAAAVVVHRVRPAAFALAAALKCGWSLGYWIGFWNGDPAFSRGYQTGAIWVGFAAVTLIISGWRENNQ